MNGVTTARFARWLQDMPTWLIEAELARRGRLERARPTALVLGDLEVDAAASRVWWRGEEHVVVGRRMELLFALAQETARGHARTPVAVLASRVFRSMHPRDAQASVRTYACYLNRELPGLMRMGRTAGVGYGLNVDAPQEKSA